MYIASHDRAFNHRQRQSRRCLSRDVYEAQDVPLLQSPVEYKPSDEAGLVGNRSCLIAGWLRLVSRTRWMSGCKMMKGVSLAKKGKFEDDR